MPYIPDSVFKGGTWETLTAVEAKVYVTLCQHYNRKERIAFPSMLRFSLYFLPFLIAALRQHKNILAIFLLNLTLGRRLLGWMLALIWSVTQ